jgi:hypothetical protein
MDTTSRWSNDCIGLLFNLDSLETKNNVSACAHFLKYCMTSCIIYLESRESYNTAMVDTS